MITGDHGESYLFADRRRPFRIGFVNVDHVSVHRGRKLPEKLFMADRRRHSSVTINIVIRLLAASIDNTVVAPLRGISTRNPRDSFPYNAFVSTTNISEL